MRYKAVGDVYRYKSTRKCISDVDMNPWHVEWEVAGSP
jgi:hypothetical protein